MASDPDDETIFGGAQLLTEQKTWKVIIITNGMGGEEKNKKRQQNLAKI